MKNKRLTIILSISGLLFLLITLIVLILLGVIPNPFLDTSDLVCKREHYYPELGVTSIEERLYSFNNKAREEKVIERYINKYETVEIAKEEYNKLLEIGENTKKLEGNMIIDEIEITNMDSIATKKEIKSFYERQYDFVCE